MHLIPCKELSGEWKCSWDFVQLKPVRIFLKLDWVSTQSHQFKIQYGIQRVWLQVLTSCHIHL